MSCYSTNTTNSLQAPNHPKWPKRSKKGSPKSPLLAKPSRLPLRNYHIRPRGPKKGSQKGSQKGSPGPRSEGSPSSGPPLNVLQTLSRGPGGPDLGSPGPPQGTPPKDPHVMFKHNPRTPPRDNPWEGPLFHQWGGGSLGTVRKEAGSRLCDRGKDPWGSMSCYSTISAISPRPIQRQNPFPAWLGIRLQTSANSLVNYRESQ